MNEKINKLQELFDSLESWAQSAQVAGLKCEKLVADIHKKIGKEIVKEKIAIKKAEIADLRNLGK